MLCTLIVCHTHLSFNLNMKLSMYCIGILGTKHLAVIIMMMIVANTAYFLL